MAEPLSRLLGPQAADNLLGIAEAGIAVLKSAAESLGSAARDGARTEWLGEPDFEDLQNRTDEMQLRLDRLTARLEQLENPP